MDARGPFAAPPPRGAIRLFSPALGARYAVESVLGACASSVLYRAFDKETKRTVALKLVRTGALTPPDLVRYRHGLAAAREAQSPALVRVLETGEATDTLTLTLEDVRGESLAQRLARGRPDAPAALRIARDVLNALSALHGLGILHRNLKPSNVLLPAAGRAVLADWGLARRWEAVVADDAHDGGLDYVSPEQALGKDLDERSDLYSFGAILFEMLTGRPPFEASRPIGLLRAHLRDRPPDVRLLDEKIPAWLAGVTARLLQKDPEARYASAADALADLGAHHARRAARKRVRRALLVAAEALLAAGLAAAWFGYRERALDSVHLLVDAGKSRLEVLDGHGRRLWTARGVANASDVALLRRGGADWAVVTPGERDGTLTVADARTGSLLGRVSLPGASASALAQVRAVDLEGRGTDVLLGAYRDREGTWSIAVHDAESRVSRRVLVSSAPHAFAGAADLDGDGRREILLAGTVPAFGHALGVAACRVPAAGAGGPALTPELGEGSDALLWYALVPQPDPSRPNLELDSSRRTVTLELGGGSRRRLEAGGFLREDRSELAAAERAAHRTRSYALLRRAAERADSVSLTREAFVEARRAADSTLAEWTERAGGVALVRAGRGEEGARLLAELASRARAPAEVALDAARAFHAVGARAEAIGWYREGLAHAAGAGARAGAELARGLVDACGELGRWDVALLELDRAEGVNPALALDTFALRAEVAARSKK
jgi:hypothetical protein